MSLFIFITCLIVVYGILYYLNHQTPPPKGMEDLKTECQGCQVTSCGNNPVHDEERKEND